LLGRNELVVVVGVEVRKTFEEVVVEVEVEVVVIVEVVELFMLVGRVVVVIKFSKIETHFKKRRKSN